MAATELDGQLLHCDENQLDGLAGRRVERGGIGLPGLNEVRQHFVELALLGRKSELKVRDDGWVEEQVSFEVGDVLLVVSDHHLAEVGQLLIQGLLWVEEIRPSRASAAI